jgi:hypothetical protein
MILAMFAAITTLQPTTLGDSATMIIASPSAETPWALGTAANVGRARNAARRCGLGRSSVRYYSTGVSKGRAVLFTVGGQKPRAVTCMNRWLASHEKEFDPLLGVE